VASGEVHHASRFSQRFHAKDRVQILRVLFFFGWSIREVGGAEFSVLGLAEGLLRAGHSVAIADVQKQGSTEKSIGSLQVPYWSIPRAPEPKDVRSSAAFARGVWQTLAVLREFRPDIFSVQSPVFQTALAVGASRLPHHWHLAITVRGSDIRVIPKTFPLLGPWQEHLFERADAVIAVSQSLLRDALNLYPSMRDKAQVIPNSLDASWFDKPVVQPTDDERHVLFVGRFHIVKGIDILLRAWSLLQGHVAGINLWLVGEGEELGSLRSLSDHLGVSKSVRFKGYRAQEELPSLYRAAEIVVLPSRNEGLPRTALEAGACGAICVGARTGGIPETILDGVTGFLVDPESPEALAQGMLRALCLPESDKRRMSAAARAHIQQNFNQETMVARYEQLFQSILRKRTAQEMA
jgi:glycosyltransferase involved in cell wall biosynthesis